MANFGTFDFGTVDLSKGVDAFLQQRQLGKQQQLQEQQLARQARQDKLSELLGRSTVSLNKAREADLATGLQKKVIDLKIAQGKEEQQSITNKLNTAKLAHESKRLNNQIKMDNINIQLKQQELAANKDPIVRKKLVEELKILETKNAQSLYELQQSKKSGPIEQKQAEANIAATKAKTAQIVMTTEHIKEDRPYQKALNEAELKNLAARTADIDNDNTLASKRLILESNKYDLQEKRDRLSAFEDVMNQSTPSSMLSAAQLYQKQYGLDDGIMGAVTDATDAWDEHSLSREGLAGKEVIIGAKEMSAKNGGDWRDYVGAAVKQRHLNKRQQTNIHLGTANKTWQEASGKTLATLVETKINRGIAAREANETTESLLRKVDESFVGAGANMKLSGSKFISAILGLPEGTKITNTEQLRQFFSKKVLTNMTFMKGAMSDKDREFILNTEATIANSKQFLKIYIKAQRRKQEVDSITGKYYESSLGNDIAYARKVMALERAYSTMRKVSHDGKTEFHNFRNEYIMRGENNRGKRFEDHSYATQLAIENVIIKDWEDKYTKTKKGK